MVEGMEVLNVVEISDAKKDTGMAIVAAAAYNVRDVKGILPKHYQDELKRFYAQKEICIQTITVFIIKLSKAVIISFRIMPSP